MSNFDDAKGRVKEAAGDLTNDQHLKNEGSSVGVDASLYKFGDFSELMGFSAVAEFDQTYRR